MRTVLSALAVLVILGLPTTAAAVPVTLTFDELERFDSESITTQYGPLVTFEFAQISTYGVSLDPFENPLPVSGENVLSDFGGFMRLVFSAPVISFSGFFNYGGPLSIMAFRNSDPDTAVATAQSLFASNLASSLNDAPNEQIMLEGMFDGILISAADFGGFTIDNLTFDIAAVPEPGTFALMLLGGTGLLLRRRRRTR